MTPPSSPLKREFDIGYDCLFPMHSTASCSSDLSYDRSEGVRSEEKRIISAFNCFLDRFLIDGIILVNMDDEEMGYSQSVKILNSEDGKFMCLAYSGSGFPLKVVIKRNENSM